jgi:hypothetical protein
MKEEKVNENEKAYSSGIVFDISAYREHFE